MSTYEIELADGSKYQIDTEDDTPATPAPAPLPGAEIGTTQDRGFWSGLYDKLFNSANNDTFVDQSGKRSQYAYMGPDQGVQKIPELSTQEGQRRTATGMGVLGSLVGSMAPIGLAKTVVDGPATLLNVPLNFTRAISSDNLLTRLGGYGGSAALASGAGLIADKAGQANGLLPTSTLREDANRFANETAVGTGVPVGVEALAGAGRALKDTGRFLRSKLSTTVTPDQVIPAQVIPAFRDNAEPGMALRGAVADKVEPGYIQPGATHPVEVAQKVESTITPHQAPDFLDSTRPSDFERSLRITGKAASGGADVEFKLENAIQKVYQIAPEVISAEPRQALGALYSKENSLIKDVNTVIDKANAGQKVVPEMNFTATEKYIDETLAPGSPERTAAAEYFQAREDAFNKSWDGTIGDLQKHKITNDRFHRNAYNKDTLSSNEEVVAQVSKKMSSDMRRVLEDNVPKLKELNSQLSSLYTVEPIVTRRAGAGVSASVRSPKVSEKVVQNTVYPYSEITHVPEKVIPGTPEHSVIGNWVGEKTIPEKVIPGKTVPGAWAKSVDHAASILAPVLGLVGGGIKGGVTSAAIGGSVGAALGNSGVSEGLGRLAGGLGSFGGTVASPVSAMFGAVNPRIAGLAATRAAPNLGIGNGVARGIGSTIPQAQAQDEPPKLPRQTAQFNSDALSQFMLMTSQRPEAPIAQKLVEKMQQAASAGDLDTMERIHSDMTRIFPDLFEDGQGVNGKIFYPDDQKKIMDNLRQLYKLGEIDSIQLAKQRNAFNNPQDSRLLPVDVKSRQPRRSPEPRFYEGVRVYEY